MKLAKYRQAPYIYRYGNGGEGAMNKVVKLGVLIGTGYIGLKVVGWILGITWSLFSFALSLGFWAGMAYLIWRGWQWLKTP